MNNYNLSFISNEDLFNHVKQTVIDVFQLRSVSQLRLTEMLGYAPDDIVSRCKVVFE